MDLAISYWRYSSPGQRDGDSIRRQCAAAHAWCERNGCALDVSAVMVDKAKSAYHGKHRKKGVLGAFMADVAAERIAPGTVLIIENLDRLSRENPWESLPLLCSIVNAGIRVVTLSPSERVYDRDSDLSGLLTAVLELARGHSESATKAGRMGEVWGEKKALARDGKGIITRKLPAWIKEEGGSLLLVRERAEVIRRMFRDRIDGAGAFLIGQRLSREGVAPWGRGQAWTKAYIKKILTGRAVLGEHQPKKGGKPDGPPILGYYPRVIDEQTWELANLKRGNGAVSAGRPGNNLAAVFSGLAVDVRTGQLLRVANASHSSGKDRARRRQLVPAGALEGAGGYVGFPNDVFEPAMLRALKEIKPADVLGEEAASESAGLATEAERLTARIAELEEELTTSDAAVGPLSRALSKLEEQLRDVTGRLAQARQREACPRSVAFAQAQGLCAVASDEANRMRLRRLLKDLLETMCVLIVRRRGTRLCAVQMWFKGGGRRDYLIVYRAAGNGRKGGWRARSFATLPDAPAGLDLRRADHARTIEDFLTNLPLDGLLAEAG